MASENETFSREIQIEYNGDYRNRNGNNNNNNNNDKRNNSYDDCFVSAVRKEYAKGNAKENQDDRRQPCRAPLVGWKNKSPTIRQNSVHDVADSSHAEKSIELMEQRDTSSEIRGTPVPGERIELVGIGPTTDRKVGSSADESKPKSKKPKIPDGGWGWMVVLASLVISMVADGVSFSFGLLYIEFLREFGASKSKTAWIGSLFMAVPLLSGPIMSALVDRYGCRNMTIAGGLISGLGFILSSFSNTIELMYLTFGVTTGLGLGLCYVTAVVSIAYWFEKKRTLAVGLGACGTGIGTFVYAPMTTYLIKEYGWRGTCLLLAGTFFNMIVSGTIMKDPEWWILEQRKNDQNAAKRSHVRSSDDAKSDGGLSGGDEFPGVEELRRLLRSDRMPEYFVQNLNTTTETVDGARRRTAFRSVVNLPTFVKRSEKVNYR